MGVEVRVETMVRQNNIKTRSGTMKKEIKIQVHNKIFSGDRNDVFVDALLTENINGVTKKLDPYIRKIKKNSPGPIICFSSATPEMIYNDKSLSVDDAIKLLQA